MPLEPEVESIKRVNQPFLFPLEKPPPWAVVMFCGLCLNCLNNVVELNTKECQSPHS